MFVVPATGPAFDSWYDKLNSHLSPLDNTSPLHLDKLASRNKVLSAHKPHPSSLEVILCANAFGNTLFVFPHEKKNEVMLPLRFHGILRQSYSSPGQSSDLIVWINGTLRPKRAMRRPLPTIFCSGFPSLQEKNRQKRLAERDVGT